VLDNVPQTAIIRAGQTVTLEFRNAPKGSLLITKTDKATGEALEGVTFRVTTSAGAPVSSSTTDDGLYKTDRNGQIVLSALEPDTYVVTEVATLDKYLLDAEPRTVVVNAGDSKSVHVTNTVKGSLVITKVDSVTKAPLSGVEFEITGTGDTAFSGGKYVTDGDGVIRLSYIPSGTYSIVETSGVDGYLVDSSVRTAEVVGGATTDVTVANIPLGGLVIKKMDAVTKEPLSNVIFKVTTADGAAVGSSGGEFRTDERGFISIPDLEPASYVIQEVQPKTGYLLDNTPKNIEIKDHKTYTVEFFNQPVGELVIKKMNSVTKEPLSDVLFKVTTDDGTVVGNSNGEFRTDENGYIRISGLAPDGYIVREVQAKPGFLLDDTPRTIEVKDHQIYELEFFNQPLGGLIIHKLDSVTKQPLEGVQFKITYADGKVVDAEGGKLSSNGLYWTDENGQIRIDGITGTVIATEVQSLPGYTIHEETRSQTVVINPDDTQTLYFYNDPVGGVEIIKVNEDDKTQRIPNTTFEIRKVDDELIDTITTDKNGRAFLALEDGAYYAVEIEAGEGFKVDPTPIYFEVENGKTAQLQVTNKAFSGILIHKTDSVTGEGIYGVSFLLYDANKNPIGEYVSDDRGYVYIDDLPTSGRYYLRELANEGYLVDDQLKTVYVTAGTTTEVEWKNTPITGQIQITKTSADYNSMNGWPAGSPLPGTVFEIYHYKTGRLVDTIQTDKNGVAVSKALPLGRYKIVESKAADYYGLDKTPIDVEIEFAGQIVKAAMTNKSLYTNVSIKKVGYTEVMPGQSIRYDFSGIANNSTTSLTSFYWRDTLPNAVRLDKIVTGTYNVQGNYKIVYRTNLSGNTYRTLADNLSTMQNYVLDASPAALGLAANEYVCEFMVSFGVVPPNFRQVEAPRVYCNVVSWLTGGTQFVNQADVGGVYDGQWIMATTRWVTTVYKPSEPLPRTGY